MSLGQQNILTLIHQRRTNAPEAHVEQIEGVCEFGGGNIYSHAYSKGGRTLMLTLNILTPIQLS